MPSLQKASASMMLYRPIECTQYASREYQELLARHALLSSMSRRGNCWNNAVAKSFFATLKIELVY
jgi:putative transposase